MIPIAGWVAPFGYPRIKACSRLPMAFRSVPRPSSPPGAKASTECPSRAHTAEFTGQASKPHTMHGNQPRIPPSRNTQPNPARLHTLKTALLNEMHARPGQTGQTTRPRSAPEPIQLPTNTRPIPTLPSGSGRSSSRAPSNMSMGTRLPQRRPARITSHNSQDHTDQVWRRSGSNR